MLPEDPHILVSYVNTQLRDFYKSLEDLCDDKDLDSGALTEKLAAAGYTYVPERNRFQ